MITLQEAPKWFDFLQRGGRERHLYRNAVVALNKALTPLVPTFENLSFTPKVIVEREVHHKGGTTKFTLQAFTYSVPRRTVILGDIQRTTHHWSPGQMGWWNHEHRITEIGVSKGRIVGIRTDSVNKNVTNPDDIRKITLSPNMILGPDHTREQARVLRLLADAISAASKVRNHHLINAII